MSYYLCANHMANHIAENVAANLFARLACLAGHNLTGCYFSDKKTPFSSCASTIIKGVFYTFT